MNNEGLSVRQLALVLLISVILVVVVLIALSLEIEGSTTLAETPRPTLPPETPTYEAYLPFIQKWALTPTPTARPTLVR